MAEQKKTTQKTWKTQGASSTAQQQKTTQKKTTNTAAKKGQQSQTKAKAQNAKPSNAKEKVQVVQRLAESTPLLFGLYTALVTGLLAAGKYYMQFTLTNEIFTRNSQDLVSHWVALSDLAFIAGLIGLVGVPVLAYYQQQGLRRLGKALVFSFLFSLIAVAIFGYYVAGLPEPEPTPQQIPGGLQQ